MVAYTANIGTIVKYFAKFFQCSYNVEYPRFEDFRTSLGCYAQDSVTPPLTLTELKPVIITESEVLMRKSQTKTLGC